MIETVFFPFFGSELAINQYPLSLSVITNIVVHQYNYLIKFYVVFVNFQVSVK